MQEKDCIKNSKKQRHNTIIRIISEKAVETQGQLTKLLISEGFDVTQATVSRDIKEMKLVEGGSTITQQLAKNIYFTQRKELTRKVAEIFMAIEIEKNCRKVALFEK